jgi:hypothetical protein
LLDAILSCVRRWGSALQPQHTCALAKGLIVGTELAVLLANGTQERRRVKSDRAKFRLVREIREIVSNPGGHAARL